MCIVLLLYLSVCFWFVRLVRTFFNNLIRTNLTNDYDIFHLSAMRIRTGTSPKIWILVGSDRYLSGEFNFYYFVSESVHVCHAIMPTFAYVCLRLNNKNQQRTNRNNNFSVRFYERLPSYSDKISLRHICTCRSRSISYNNEVVFPMKKQRTIQRSGQTNSKHKTLA